MSRLRRTLQWAVRLIAILMGLVILIFAGALLPTSRDLIAKRALYRLSSHLPGRMEASSVDWDLPLRLQLTDFCWSDGPDTLAASRRIRTSAEMRALLSGDVHLHELFVDAGQLDIDAVRSRFDRGEEDATESTADSSFPRAGSIAPLPSVGADSVSMTLVVRGMNTPMGDRLRLRASASIELRHGLEPLLELAEFELWAPQRELHAQGERVSLRPERRSMSGQLRLQPRPDSTYEITIDSADDGITLRAEGSGEDAFRSTVQGELAWLGDERVPSGARFDLRAERLDLVEILSRLGVESWPPQLPAQRSLTAELDGSLHWTPGLRVQSEVRLTQLVGLPPLSGIAHASADSIRVTQFSAVDDSFGVRGSWAHVDGRDEIDSHVTLRSAAVLGRFDVALPPELEARDLDLRFSATIADSLQSTWVLAGSSRGHPLRLNGTLRQGPSGWWLGLPPLRWSDDGLHAVAQTRPSATLRWHDSSLSARRLELSSDWVDLEVDGHLRQRPSGFEFAAKLAFESEGWSRSIPSRIALDDLGPLRGTAELSGKRLDGEFSLAALVDPRESSWVEGDSLHVRYEGGVAHLDSFRLRLAEVELSGGGSWIDDSWSARGTVAVEEIVRLRTRLGIEQDFDAARLDASWSVEGPTRSPRTELQSTWTGLISPAVAPRVDVDLQLEAARLHAARLLTPEGVRYKRWPLQSLRAELRHPRLTGSGTDHWLGIVAEGDSLNWSQVLRFSWGDTIRAVTDSLGIRWRDRDLASTQPFEFLARPAEQHFELHDLSLAGSLGDLSAELLSTTDSLTAHVDLDLSPGGVPVALSQGPWGVVWPRSVQAHLDADGYRSLLAKIDMNGLNAGPDHNLKLTVLTALDADSLRAELHLGTKDADRRLHGWLRAPIQWGDESPTDIRVGSATRGEILLESVAIPTRREESRSMWQRYLVGESDDQAAPRLDARATIGERFRTEIRGDVSFPVGHPLTNDTLGLQALHDSTTATTGQIEWMRSGELVLQSEFAVAPTGADSTRHWTASLDARRLNLADVSDLVGHDVGVQGLLDVDLELQRGSELPRVDGNLRLTDLQIAREDGNRLVGDARLEFRAPAGQRQTVRGRADIRRGTLRLEEHRRELYPRTGSSLLWTAFEIDPAPIARPPEPSPLKRLSAIPADAQPDVEFIVDIPGGVRLRSSRFDVELSGELRLTTESGRARLAGELRPIGGGVRMLNSYFRATSGTVSFLGTDEVDPRLDLVLETQRGELKVELLITGRASEPVITLRSTPPLDEGEILSRLYFNTGSDDLDSSQTDFLAFQAMSLAQTYAVPGIEQQLVNELGLDVVRIGQSETKPGTQALTAGKYLNPRVLLSYEKRLKSNESYVLNLRYWMTRSLTLDSTLGNIDPSSIEVNWTKDW